MQQADDAKTHSRRQETVDGVEHGIQMDGGVGIVPPGELDGGRAVAFLSAEQPNAIWRIRRRRRSAADRNLDR